MKNTDSENVEILKWLAVKTGSSLIGFWEALYTHWSVLSKHKEAISKYYGEHSEVT